MSSEELASLLARTAVDAAARERERIVKIITDRVEAVEGWLAARMFDCAEEASMWRDEVKVLRSAVALIVEGKP